MTKTFRNIAILIAVLFVLSTLPAMAQEDSSDEMIAFSSQGDTWVRTYADHVAIERAGVSVQIPVRHFTMEGAPLESGVIVTETADAALLAFSDGIYLLSLLDNNGWQIELLSGEDDRVYMALSAGDYAMCVVTVTVENAVPSLQGLAYSADGSVEDCRESINWSTAPNDEIISYMTTVLASSNGDN